MGPGRALSATIVAVLLAAAGGVAPVAAQTIPAAPTDLEATAEPDALRIVLSWQDNAGDEDSYVVERSTDGGGGPWTVIATLPPDTTEYTDPGLQNMVTYWYRVAAVNAAGTSGYSNVAFATASEFPRAVTVPPTSTALVATPTPSLPATGSGTTSSRSAVPWIVAAVGALFLLAGAGRFVARRR